MYYTKCDSLEHPEGSLQIYTFDRNVHALYILSKLGSLDRLDGLGRLGRFDRLGRWVGRLGRF
mgnify:CR=1 FL=1